MSFIIPSSEEILDRLKARQEEEEKRRNAAEEERNKKEEKLEQPAETLKDEKSTDEDTTAGNVALYHW